MIQIKSAKAVKGDSGEWLEVVITDGKKTFKARMSNFEEMKTKAVKKVEEPKKPEEPKTE